MLMRSALMAADMLLGQRSLEPDSGLVQFVGVMVGPFVMSPSVTSMNCEASP